MTDPRAARGIPQRLSDPQATASVHWTDPRAAQPPRTATEESHDLIATIIRNWGPEREPGAADRLADIIIREVQSTAHPFEERIAKALERIADHFEARR